MNAAAEHRIPSTGRRALRNLFALGFAALIAGCVLAYRAFDPVTATILVGGVVATTTAFLWWVPRSAFGKDVVHRGSLGEARASELRSLPGTRSLRSEAGISNL